MNLDFTRQTVLITGATKGIGAAIASAFEASGASLILTGTQQEQIDAANACNKRQGKDHIRWMQVDFSSHESTTSFLEAVEHGAPIDVLINNAGTNIISPIDQVLPENFDSLLSINLRAPLLLCKSVSLHMQKNSYGRIVNIASIWSVITKPGRAMYTATKTGLVGLTRAAAMDLAPYGILVNAVSPGFVNTELTTATLSSEEREQLSRQVPLGRFAEPEEIAKTVLFLSSGLNTYITGQNLVVDGGYVCI
jgi:3-oxoacyl-[acyl-carrier protein] reductase